MARPLLARAAGGVAEGDVDEVGVAEEATDADGADGADNADEADEADGADGADGADEADTECGGAVKGGEADTLRASTDS